MIIKKNQWQNESKQERDGVLDRKEELKNKRVLEHKKGWGGEYKLSILQIYLDLIKDDNEELLFRKYSFVALYQHCLGVVILQRVLLAYFYLLHHN